MLVLALGGSVSPIAPRQVTLEGLFPPPKKTAFLRERVIRCGQFLLYFFNTMDRCNFKISYNSYETRHSQTSVYLSKWWSTKRSISFEFNLNWDLLQTVPCKIFFLYQAKSLYKWISAYPILETQQFKDSELPLFGDK